MKRLRSVVMASLAGAALAVTGAATADDPGVIPMRILVGEVVPVGPGPAPATRRSGLITLGEGDPFGDVVDEEPTPVRHEIEPKVVVPAPIFDRVVRAEDNQLHLRLHGTGAIAESGQVRALDIEVPVPGTWVGNRRVTLQLRLTLLPVAEDDDGGSGGAP